MFFTAFSFAQESLTEDSQKSNFVVKFAPVQVFFGEFAFSFEHSFKSKMSYEVSFGTTLSNLLLSPDNIPNVVIASSDTKLGLMISGAFRYYPLANMESPNGFFISPELKYRFFRSEYLNSQFVKDISNRNLNNFIVRLNIGYQFIFKNKFSLDLFTGFGADIKTGIFPTSKISSETGGQADVVIGKYNSVRPAFTVGIRIGLAGKL